MKNNNPTPQSVIEGRGLCKNFKDFWGRKKVGALTDVDIAIKKGSVFGLLGPNGAGKSTLIKLILGHLYPTRGRLVVLGKGPRDVSVKSKIGYLPETSYLYKSLNAQETLKYFGTILGLTKEQIKKRSHQLLEMVGLEIAKNRLVGEFSHGMKRRLGLAQALLNDPSLLILDEPTAGLDPIGCREVKDLIITLGKRGKTILLTSHLLADVEDVCDEILVLFGGRAQASGSVSELLKNRKQMQLQFPVVDKRILDEAISVLTQEVEPDSIVSTSPLESLENFFLKVVAKSTAQMQETYGAQMGKGVAEYLRDDRYQQRDLLTELTRGNDREAPQKAAIDNVPLASLAQPKNHSSTLENSQPKEEVDRATLDKLSGDESKKGPPGAVQGKDKSIDQNLLDDLTTSKD